jgi:hypothetical protein
MRVRTATLTLFFLTSLVLAQAPKQHTKKSSVEKKVESKDTTSPPNEANVAKAREILKKTLEAMGGKALLAIKDIVQTMSVTTSTPEGDMQIDMEGTFMVPDKVRQKITMPFGEMTVGFDGEKGWMKTPMAEGIQDLPELQKGDLKNGLASNLYNILQHFDGKEYLPEFVRDETIDGKRLHIVSITHLPTRSSFRFLIDASTLLVVKRFSQRTTQMGTGEVEESYSDYRNVNGVQVSFHIVSKMQGAPVAEVKINSFKINSGVKDETFKKP